MLPAIIGIVGQALLLTLAVLGWWIITVPLQWKCLSKPSNSISKSLISWAEPRREEIQKVLLICADTQAVTGLAMTTAGLLQFHASPAISTYHACIISDLLSISANGQAAMLFYAFRPTSEPVEQKRTFPWKDFGPRLFISVSYIAVFYAWSAAIYSRFTEPEDTRDCLLNIPPQNGNYGIWSMLEATLMLLFVVLAVFQAQLRSLGPRVGEQWKKVFKFVYDSFLPLFIVIYFLWSFVDLITLKVANSSLLVDTSESHIEAFGQVVPIVLLLVPGLSLWDVFAKDIPETEVEHLSGAQEQKQLMHQANAKDIKVGINQASTI